MSENIDINVGIIKEEISINAANNIVEVNISTAPVTVINPQNYDLSQFTNTSPNPFIRQSSLSSYVPISRIITINGVAQDLSTDRSWTIPTPSITGLVPYIGANANVNLGEYELTAGQLTLDTSPTGVATVGTTRWNNTIGSSETTLKGGSVILKNGVDLVARVVNKVTPNATLTKANYTAVRVSGAQGQRLAVAYAQANNDTNSADTLGLVTETIPTNQEGFIITVGQLEGINTTGSLQGESWSDGDVLYLSPTTPGAITNIKPSGITGHIIVIGYVEYAHANNGKIYVKIMNGWELDELHNVYIDPLTLANNNILQYDSSTQLWRNQVLNTGITIGTTAITSGTVGRVLFEGTGNVVQESANLFWDNTNGRLGIGTATPTVALDIVGAGKFSTNLNVGSTTFTSTATPNFISLGATYGDGTNFGTKIKLLDSGATQWGIGISSATGINYFGAQHNFYGSVSTEVVKIFSSTSNSSTATPSYLDLGSSFSSTAGANPKLRLFGTSYAIGMSAGAVEYFAPKHVFYTGNVLINTTTDAGYKLDVNGTARVSGNLTLTGGSLLMNNNNIYIARGTGGASDGMEIRALSSGTDAVKVTTSSVSISSSGGITYQASAQLAVDSTTRGFLPPRMTTTQKNAIATPATGLQVFDTTLNRPCFYDGTTWITL